MTEENTAQYDIALPPGFQLGEYIIRQVIGQGGFGITYLAFNEDLQVNVVIKENMPTMFAGRNPQTGEVFPVTRAGADVTDYYEWALKRFREEAQTLAKLKHRNIVRVMRVFKALGTVYYVMPYVGGASLNDLTENQDPFSPTRLNHLLCVLLDALRHVHGKGLLHRDIKPSNILIDDEGEPILIDFGAARQLSQHSQTVIESPGYTPFEQLQTHGNVGPWTDLYALGCTMYRVITGKHPMRSTDRIIDDPQPRLADNADLCSQYSKSFLSGIDKAMSLKVSERWQTAEDWLQAIAHGKEPQTLGSESVQESPSDAGKQYVLGLRYLYGAGVKQNLPEAAKWIASAAGQGHFLAQYSLGCLYEHGYGLAQDPNQASAWIMRASNLAASDQSVRQEYQQALEWICAAAEQGDMDAQFILGCAYSDALGVSRDDQKAVLWYRKAADQGHPWGQLCLGGMYAEGRGVAQDDCQAIAWFKKSAEQGNAKALHYLSWMKEAGRGVVSVPPSPIAPHPIAEGSSPTTHTPPSSPTPQEEHHSTASRTLLYLGGGIGGGIGGGLALFIGLNTVGESTAYKYMFLGAIIGANLFLSVYKKIQKAFKNSAASLIIGLFAGGISVILVVLLTTFIFISLAR